MDQTKKHDKVKLLVATALFAALTTLMTSVFKIPFANGYAHCGDAVIYLSAAVLPLPYAMIASAVGAALADLFTGYAIYAIPTFLIKALVAATFWIIGGKRLFCPRRVVGLVACAVVSYLCYAVADLVLLGGSFAALLLQGAMRTLLIQGGTSAVVYSVVAIALDRIPHKAQMSF